VIDTWPNVFLRVDSTHVLLKTISSIYTASNRAVLVDFSFHAISSRKTVVVGSIVSLVVSNGNAVVEATVTFGRGRTMAVSADINWVAVILVKILCNILNARRIGDTIVISIVINT
jgi:hypothetical protein